MNNDKKPYILKAFREMDIEMLELLLNDDQEYQDFSKAFFLVNLSDFFDLFREKGDTYLRCMGGICNGCAIGCSGFLFAGNNSRCFTSFVFEAGEFDYKDIYYCSRFKPNEGIQDLAFKLTFDVDTNINFEDEDCDLPF